MKRLFMLFLTICAAISLSAQVQIQWQKCYGGTNTERAKSIQQTTDGGYIVAGFTGSNDGAVFGNHGISDIWVVKTDLQGIIQWQKCFGGTNGETANSIQQTTDGGYIIAGCTDSNNGDVSGNHSNYDFWVVKLDSQGNFIWQKCLGGTNSEFAYSIQQTTDGGFIVAGYTHSTDGDVNGNHGDRDFWVVKLNATGTLQWQKCLGGTSADEAQSVQQTSDGGFIVAGQTYSNDGDVSGIHGSKDLWIVKIDATGTLQWQKCLGGTSADEAQSIQLTSDGGYIVAGITGSNDGDVLGNHGAVDFWVVKLDENGTVQWQKCLGGTGYDWAYSIQQNSDGGFVVAGHSNSTDGDVIGNHGNYDFWVVKLNATGTLLWQKCLGGTSADEAKSVQQTIDGGYIVTGQTFSNDGDVSGLYGGEDFWVVKLIETNNIFHLENITSVLNCLPNPAREKVIINLPEFTRKVEVYNSAGSLVQQLVPQKQVAEINAKELAKGVYVVKIFSGKGVITTRFVKE
jgi:hypothetical protein